MRPLVRATLPVLVAAGVAIAARAIAGTGDALCDPIRSSTETCVITGLRTVPAGSSLLFDHQNVRIEGAIAVETLGHCAGAPETSCAGDEVCGEQGPCQSGGEVGLTVGGELTVVTGGRITSRGGAIDITAGSAAIRGVLSVATRGRGREAGEPAQRIALDTPGSLVVDHGAVLDASAGSGACGGRVTIGGRIVPTTVTIAGTVTSDAATLGGEVLVSAQDGIVLSGRVEASNTDGDPARRARCPQGRGGGPITLAAKVVHLRGRLHTEGREASGGRVTLAAERELLIEWTGAGPAVDASGGDVDAFSGGGDLSITASAGDVSIRRGAVVTDGRSLGIGSDGGLFTIEASSEERCLAGDTPCAGDGDCADDDRCVEQGGHVLVASPLSARGGAGAGFGCVDCRISASRSVTVTGTVDLSGGGQDGIGGELTVTAGGEVSVGPGALVATGEDGGVIGLTAGLAPLGEPGERTGTLHVAPGTRLRAEGSGREGSGAEIALEACTIDVGAGAELSASGGANGSGGAVVFVARETVDVGGLAVLEAVPDGTIEVFYRRSLSVAGSARLEPEPTLVQDGELVPCPGCGNDVVESGEDCDGTTCPASGSVCVPAGDAEECTCIATCGALPGIQPGEECDGEDLGGETCAARGFAGGTLRCDAACRFDTAGCAVAVCGDGIVSPGEACDPGGIGAPPGFGGATCESIGFPAGGSLVCASLCEAILTSPHCSVTRDLDCTENEDCPPGEACVAGCRSCGNGFVDVGEECDRGVLNSDTAPDACRQDCRLPRCGDGVLDPERGESCDDGDQNGESRPCTPACERARCGDALVCSAAECATGPGDGPEQCDDGNTEGGDDCEPGCALPACGNGVLDEGEECDDGNRDEGDLCDPNCTRPRCGNGVVDQGEECDPPSPCCDPACRLPTCDDDNPCTADACDAGTGCVHDATVGAACSDGDACTTADACDAGGTCRGAPLSCDVGDACRIPSCHPVRGCEWTRPAGFGGLRCLPAAELREIIAADGTLSLRLRRTLERPAAIVGETLAEGVAAGPGARAHVVLRRTRRAAALLSRRADRLHRIGRLAEGPARELVALTAEIAAGVSTVVP